MHKGAAIAPIGPCTNQPCAHTGRGGRSPDKVNHKTSGPSRRPRGPHTKEKGYPYSGEGKLGRVTEVRIRGITNDILPAANLGVRQVRGAWKSISSWMYKGSSRNRTTSAADTRTMPVPTRCTTRLNVALLAPVPQWDVSAPAHSTPEPLDPSPP